MLQVIYGLGVGSTEAIASGPETPSPIVATVLLRRSLADARMSFVGRLATIVVAICRSVAAVGVRLETKTT